MALELIILAANINFVVYSVYLDDILGQIYTILVLTVGAAETAIGIAILIVYYRLRGGIAVSLLTLLKS